jgi:ELWxxDGT repeat protein
VERLEGRALLAAVPQMIANLNETPAWSPYDQPQFTSVGDVAYFTADDPVTGRELWVTDGSEAGTRLVADLVPGLSGSNPQSLVPFRGGLAFVGRDASGDWKVWTTDGTAANTKPLASEIGDSYRGPSEALAVVGDTLYFLGDGPSPRGALWKSDGTPAGTARVTQFPVDHLTAVDRTVFFVAYPSSAGYGELWASDGTRTALVKDIRPGSSTSFPDHLTAAGVNLFFTADDGVHGRELWISGGTSDSTRLITDYDVRPGDPGVDQFAAFGNALVYTVRETDRIRMFMYSESSEGSVLLHEFGNPGDTRLGFMAEANGFLYFTEDVGATTRLWRTDGTAAGTQPSGPLTWGGPNPDSTTKALGRLGDELYLMVANAPHFDEAGLYLFDPVSGQFSDAVALDHLETGWSGVAGRKVVFFQVKQGEGPVLWSSNGTTAGTQPIRGFGRGDASMHGIFPMETRFVPTGDGMAFVAQNGSANFVVPWRTDGTRDGTFPLMDPALHGSTARATNLVSLGGNVYFRNQNNSLGDEMWITDGTPEGTHVFLDLAPGWLSSHAEPLSVLGGSLLFTAYDEEDRPGLWKTDGTAGGTSVLTTFRSWPSHISRHVVVGDTVYFVVVDETYESILWKSDGTAAGTTPVADVLPGSAQGYVASMIAVGERLYFTVRENVHSLELWTSDGTPGGTRLIVDLNPGPNDSGAWSLAVMGDQLYFGGTDGLRTGLWRTDGTPAGTTFVSAGPRGEALYISDLVTAGNRLFFQGYDSAHGYEVWVSDGTAGGTRLVKDIDPGPAHGRPENLTVLDGILYFAANDSEHGIELWRSDGTDGGTRLVADLFPGIDGSAPYYLTAHAGAMYFTADDGRHGREPWIYVPDGPVPSRPAADLDGDRRGDMVTYRPDTSEFFVRYADGRAERIAFGPGSAYTGAATPPVGVAADLDLDGKTDLTVYRPDTSEFFVRYADGRTERIAFGPGSVYTGAAVPPAPIVADLDFSGAAEMVVYRPDTSEFFVRHAGGRTERIAFGPGSAYTGAATPPVGLAADLDGDGTAELIAYRPDTSEFFVWHTGGRTERIGFGPGSLWTGAGVPPVPSASDVDGDGRADLVVYRPDTSEFFVRYADGRAERVAFGPGSAYTGADVPPLPVVNDLDGDGTAELIAYRPDTSEFFIRHAGGLTGRVAFGPGSAYTGAAVPPSPLPSSVSAWSLLVPLDDDLLLAAFGGLGPRGTRVGRGR